MNAICCYEISISFFFIWLLCFMKSLIEVLFHPEGEEKVKIRGARKKFPNIFKHFLKLNTFSVHLRLMTLTWFVISFSL